MQLCILSHVIGGQVFYGSGAEIAEKAVDTLPSTLVLTILSHLVLIIIFLLID